MNEVPPPYSPPPYTPQPTGLSLRSVLNVAYGLFALGFITGGLGAIASVVLCYLKRGDAAGTVYASHFDWLLRTFWWAVLWGVVSTILLIILIGWLGYFLILLWVLYRVIKGWLNLAEGRPVGPTAL